MAPPRGGLKQGAKANAKGAKGFLGKKLGPLPTWAWLALVLIAVGAFWMMRRRPADTGGGEPFGMAALPPDGAFSGAPGSNAAPAQSMDPAVLDEFRSQLMGQIGDVRGHVTELEDAWGVAQGQQVDWGSQIEEVRNEVAATTAAVALLQQPPAPKQGTAGGAKKPTPAKKNQPAPATKFYTYKPGKAPAGKKSQQAPAKAPPGKKLKFQKGKGYYYG